jgi:hypothetical protein
MTAVVRLNGGVSGGLRTGSEGVGGEGEAARVQFNSGSKQDGRAAASPDPLIENLLQGARSERVRAEFRAIPPSDYTEHVPVTFLVRPPLVFFFWGG